MSWCLVGSEMCIRDRHQLAQLMANMDSFGKKALGDDYVSFADIAEVLDEAQEQSHECQNP
jgi:hypothetical protein